MASLEQLQQLDDDDSSTSSSGSSSSSSSEEGEAVSVPVEEPPPKRPPKMRLKLSLRLPKASQLNGKMGTPTNAGIKTTAPEAAIASPEPHEVVAMEVDDDDNDDNDDNEEETQNSKNSQMEEDDEHVVKASVVASDDEDADEDDEVQTAAVDNETSSVTPSSTSNKESGKTTATKAATTARRSPTPLPNRPVRLPPMSSPGLLIPPTSGVYRGEADANGFTTPASVFNHGMFLAGYTTEARTTSPHRGSSVKRVVDDMFDSNVHFTLHFPSLVPKDLWNGPPLKQAKKEDNGESTTTTDQEEETGETLPDLLLRALSKPAPPEDPNNCDVDMQDTAEKPNSCPSLVDMAPVSLTLPYPKAYMQKRIEYAEQVEERERAIVASQEAAEAYDDVKEAYEEALSSYNSSQKGANGGSEGDGAPVKPPKPTRIQIPPIPEPPSPPRHAEMGNKDATNEGKDEKSDHPFYIPKGSEKLVEHLDKKCFHITDGRYYGLLTSRIADPHFVGPNAPGITGLTVSGGTGLATSYTGSGSNSGGAGPSLAYYGGSVGGGSSAAPTKSAGDGSKVPTKKAGTALSGGNGENRSHSAVSKKENTGPTPTSNAMDLKRLMEQGDSDTVEQMRQCIIRAAVYASRTSAHGGSFVAVNKETYPDISKAFAAHAGLKPCNRCKNNKQGAYHCRLRRKHKDSDYDGGASWEALAPLFEEPVDDLLLR